MNIKSSNTNKRSVLKVLFMMLCISILYSPAVSAQMGWVNSPEDNSTYTLGETIEINISPTGSVSLGGISINGTLTIQLGNETVYSTSVSASGSPARIVESFKPAASGTYTMNVNVGYYLYGFSTDTSSYSCTFTVIDGSSGDSGSSSGDNGSSDPSDNSQGIKPDPNCHFDVISDDDNSCYYITLKEYEYTLDLNGNNLAQIDYSLISYDPDSQNIHGSWWIQTGSDKFIETVSKTEDKEVALNSEQVYERQGKVSFKGIACGTAVIEFYIQVIPETGSYWYDRHFVKIHVIDSSKKETGTGDDGADGSTAEKGDGKKQTTPASCKTHTYGKWTVKKAATFKAAGNKQRVCSVCKNVQTASISKLKAKAGMKLKDKKASYKILKNLKTVAYVAPLKKNVKSVVVPAAVTILGKSFKVTQISAKAFSGCTSS